jgi:calcineurin-like phosphoesterase
MDFKVLAVGDVVGNPGMDRICRSLRQLKRQTCADFVTVCGENACLLGMTPQQGEDILDAGADVITMGNHTFGRREIVDYLDDNPRILRPANYAPQSPGRGWGVFDTRVGPVAVIDLIGRCHMDYTPDNPFLQIEKILKNIKDIKHVTFSEKDVVRHKLVQDIIKAYEKNEEAKRRHEK